MTLDLVLTSLLLSFQTPPTLWPGGPRYEKSAERVVPSFDASSVLLQVRNESEAHAELAIREIELCVRATASPRPEAPTGWSVTVRRAKSAANTWAIVWKGADRSHWLSGGTTVALKVVPQAAKASAVSCAVTFANATVIHFRSEHLQKR